MCGPNFKISPRYQGAGRWAPLSCKRLTKRGNSAANWNSLLPERLRVMFSRDPAGFVTEEGSGWGFPASWELVKILSAAEIWNEDRYISIISSTGVLDPTGPHKRPEKALVVGPRRRRQKALVVGPRAVPRDVLHPAKRQNQKRQCRQKTGSEW